MFRLARQRTTQVSEVTRKRATIICVESEQWNAQPRYHLTSEFRDNPAAGVLVVEVRGVVAQTAQTPRRGPKVALPGAVPATSASAPAGAHLTYYGGRVVSNVQIVQMLWGTGTYLPQSTSSAAPSLATFFQAVASSNYMDWLDSEYNTVNNNNNAAPLAWYDNTNGEIGDICTAQQGNFGPTGDGQTYTLQYEFSSQTFTAPASVTRLSLWYEMTCPDTITYDWATATLNDNTTARRQPHRRPAEGPQVA